MRADPELASLWDNVSTDVVSLIAPAYLLLGLSGHNMVGHPVCRCFSQGSRFFRIRVFHARIVTAPPQGTSNEYMLEVLMPFSDGEDRSRPWDEPIPSGELLALMRPCEPRSVSLSSLCDFSCQVLTDH